MIEHSSREHALLSASGATRWINCPPSARMEEALGIDDSSVYAEEGTLAHEMAETKLRILSHVGGLKGHKEQLQSKLADIRSSELYDPEMEGYVEVYTDYVLESFAAAKKSTRDAILIIEDRVDFSHIVPEGFGTADAVIIADGTLEVIDFKYGKGVQVSAVGNSQGRLYGVGALRKYELLYDIHTVKITIVQPRLDNISTEIISVNDLLTWAEGTVKPAAGKAFEGEGEGTPGDWCRWCKAKPVCRALADYSMQVVSEEFSGPASLTDEELVKIYGKIPLVSKWIEAVSSFMLSAAKAGKKWTGYKLVEGRSARKWADEQKALKALLGRGFNKGDIVNVKLKGITDLEKLVGEKTFASLKLTVKPPGSPTLVPESDKKPAIGVEQATEDFK